MKINDGGSAFPRGGSLQDYPVNGMSLRDYFAAKAMQGLITLGKDGINFRAIDADKSHAQIMAENAYFMADAMIESRKKVVK